MSEQFENINFWAEKLQQVDLPGIAQSWRSMETLLDEKMPITKNKDWKRWSLLIILLLLLIGVCNCPGIIGVNKFFGKNELPVTDQIAKEKKEIKNKTNSSSDKTENSTIENKKDRSKDAYPVTENDNKETKNKTVISENSDLTTSTKNNFKKTVHKEINSSGNYKTNNGSFVEEEKKQQVKQNNKENKIDDGELNADQLEKSTDPQTKNPNEPAAKSALNISHSDPLTQIKNTDSLKYKPVSKEIKKQKDPAPTKKIKADSVEDAKGFLFAIGLNQSFPVGAQQKANFNSSGTSGNLGDYIPVPVARYYFHKWFYIQAETQFNTPQYTRPLLADQTRKNGVAGDTLKASFFIKKLFYFNIPVSIHYSPFKNLFVGTGLQFSRLTNGVGLSENSRIDSGSLRDSVLSEKIETFKNDPVYKKLKTYEFRFLFDINYQWKSLNLGLRYNQAFTNFINVHVSNTIFTQAHNSSLQLYLRYTLWDKRKKFLLPK